MPAAQSARRATPWREPASLLPLPWGAYRPRLVAGIAMLVGGTGCILVTTTYSLPFLLIGSLMQSAAWAVIPSTIGRRAAVAVPVLGFTWLMLGGSGFAWCYAVTLAAWLVVRLRPLVAFAALLLPIASSVALPPFVTTYEQGWITVLVSTVTVVAGAWTGRAVAVGEDSWHVARTLRKSTD